MPPVVVLPALLRMVRVVAMLVVVGVPAMVVVEVVAVAPRVPVRVPHRVVIVEALGLEDLDIAPAHVLPVCGGVGSVSE